MFARRVVRCPHVCPFYATSQARTKTDISSYLNLFCACYRNRKRCFIYGSFNARSERICTTVKNEFTTSANECADDGNKRRKDEYRRHNFTFFTIKKRHMFILE